MYLVDKGVVFNRIAKHVRFVPVEDPEGCVDVRELEVDGGGGQNPVALQQAARHLRHVGEALEVVEVDVGHVPAAKLLQHHQVNKVPYCDKNLDI